MSGIAETLRRASSAVEDFRGDYDRLAAMMRASWEQNPAPPFLYTAEFLADCFTYPGASFALAPTIYDGSDPVAFAVGYPRRVSAGGLDRRILISTLLTVAPQQKSSGYGIVVWGELMRRAVQAGFDGVVNYCVDGEAMDHMIDGICRRLGFPLTRVASFSYLAKSMWIAPVTRGMPGTNASAEHLMSAAAQMGRHAEIARLWSADESVWQLARLGGVSVQAGSDRCPGVLTGYLTSVADAVRTRCLVIEDVLWGELEDEARQTLVGDVVTRAVSAGARMAIVPVLGYADMEPFVAAGFAPVKGTTHAYLTMWAGGAPHRAVDGYYLDVI